MQLDELLRTIEAPRGPLGIHPEMGEAELIASFGAPAARAGRRKSGFWTLRFELDGVTMDASFVSPDTLALVHFDGVELTPPDAIEGWSVEPGEDDLLDMRRDGIQLSLERHGRHVSVGWQL